MIDVTCDRLAEARDRHRAGDLAGARAGYEALLGEMPGDAELRGLMAVLALQEGRTAEAEAHLDRADAAVTADPRVRLRNLNTRLVLLGQQERKAEATALVEAELPEWPAGAAPDVRERETLLSLAEALLVLRQPAKALALLAVAAPDPAGDARALGLTGRARLGLGEAEAAAGLLGEAVRLAPDDFSNAAALSIALVELGQHREARGIVDELALAHRFHAAPAQPCQAMDVLVLNPTPPRFESVPRSAHELHFRENYAAQVSVLMAGRYRFLSLLADRPCPDEPWSAHAPRVVVNNLVNGEEMNAPGRIEMATALVERIGLPVINHPRAVFATTRQKTAELLSGVENLVVPRIERYQTRRATPEEIAADIDRRFDFPVILRKPRAHQSSDVLLEDGRKASHLARSPGEVVETLAEQRWTEIYAIQYVDLRKPQGWWRKLRAIFMDDEIVLSSAGFFDQWMVVGWRARPPGIKFYRDNPAAMATARRLVTDPEGELGPELFPTLRRIRARVPLDMFGIDFDVDGNGRLVFFEGTAAMIFEPPRGAADLWMPEEPCRRVHDAFHGLLARRAEGEPSRWRRPAGRMR